MSRSNLTPQRSLASLACRIVGDNAIAGVCGACTGEIGADGVVVLPEGGRGPMRAFCGDCLRVDPEAPAAIGEQTVSFFEAFLLVLTANGCPPRSVASAEAAA